MIYLDNAATTLHKPPEVAQALVQALNRAGNAARGVHEGALAAARAIYGARERLAQLFGCPRADHVAFTCNATEALNIAIAGAIAQASWLKGRPVPALFVRKKPKEHGARLAVDVSEVVLVRVGLEAALGEVAGERIETRT